MRPIGRLADELTGGLNTGVTSSQTGWATAMVVAPARPGLPLPDDDARVWNTESRGQGVVAAAHDRQRHRLVRWPWPPQRVANQWSFSASSNSVSLLQITSCLSRNCSWSRPRLS